jgi:hypothetical protein
VAYGPRDWDNPDMIQAIEGMFGTGASEARKQ